MRKAQLGKFCLEPKLENQSEETSSGHQGRPKVVTTSPDIPPKFGSHVACIQTSAKGSQRTNLGKTPSPPSKTNAT